MSVIKTDITTVAAELYPSVDCEGCGKDMYTATGLTLCMDCKSSVKSEEHEKKQREYKYPRDPHSQKVAARYSGVRAGANKRNIAFELSFDEFIKYYQLPCTYCGDTTPNVNLDRVNNTEGYTSGNVTPCCPTCNSMKNNSTVDEFYAHIERILKNRQ